MLARDSVSRHPLGAEPTREILPSLRESLLSHNDMLPATAQLASDRGYTSNTSAGTAASGWWAPGDAEQLAHPRSFGRPRLDSPQGG